MNIVQTEDELLITSVDTEGYIYIHVIQITIPSTATVEDYVDPIFTDETSTTTLTTDGYFQIVEFQLPIQALTSGAEGEYYIAGEKVYDWNDVEVPIADLLLLDTDGTNIVREDQDLISIYLLNTYYINLVKAKFLKNITSCDCLSKSDRLIMDSLTMGLTLIEYLTSYAQYYEVARIISQLLICTGINIGNCNCND